MNALIVGANKSDIFKLLPDTFLFIDDGDLLDAIPLPERRKVTRLDLTVHSFNPLKDIDYRRARELVAIINAVFPEGENTLTKKSANFALLKALLSAPRKLDGLITPIRDDPGTLDAHQKLQTILLSPVLNRFLSGATNFSFDGILLAKLDRTVLSDFDAFLVANLLISNYRGCVVVPDFGFYECAFHVPLIRQDRLIAGVNFLDESRLRNQLLLIKDKRGAQCTADDAETLAGYSGFAKGTNAYTAFIEQCLTA